MGDPSGGGASTSNGVGGGMRKRIREIESLSVEIRKYPRDLFHSFLSTEPIKAQSRLNRSASVEQEDGGIELNLGLSLGGRFGVDKSNGGGLIRASSISGTVPTFREVQEPPAALARTASLPAETEEEWRSRKEMQTLRRMEAKRRRSEKQRSSKDNNGNGTGEDRVRQQLAQGFPGSFAGQWGGSGVKGKGGLFGSLQGLLAQQVPHQPPQVCSQGSGESYGGGSSGVSDLDGKTHQGSGSCGEARSPGSQEASPVGSSSSKQREGAGGGGIEDMPCVFTIGDGPKGRKVEGILYKYGKGEEVRIMCVCHGSFFSPAEFVKHAGGCDVEHPLRHIVVNPSPSAF